MVFIDRQWHYNSIAYFSSKRTSNYKQEEPQFSQINLVDQSESNMDNPRRYKTNNTHKKTHLKTPRGRVPIHEVGRCAFPQHLTLVIHNTWTSNDY
jgi:hypothetical protein